MKTLDFINSVKSQRSRNSGRYLSYWSKKTAVERLMQTERLRREYWMKKLGYYPEKIEKVATVIDMRTGAIVKCLR